MTDSLKSIIRHILTALGVVLAFVGLEKYTGIIEYVSQNLDVVWGSILTLVGFVTTIWGFFFKRTPAEGTP